jgi:hypothetical protein
VGFRSTAVPIIAEFGLADWFIVTVISIAGLSSKLSSLGNICKIKSRTLSMVYIGFAVAVKVVKFGQRDK